jgi:hypothetical protein
MSLVAPILTLVIGLLAVVITIQPPSTSAGRKTWIGCFSVLTALAIIAAAIAGYQDSRDKADLKNGMATANKNIEAANKNTEAVLTSNLDMKEQINDLKLLIPRAPDTPVTKSGCLQADVQDELQKINQFLRDRLAKSPAYDLQHANEYAHDSHYSEKQEAYQQETSRLYIQTYWPSIQGLFRRAISSSIKPFAVEDFAKPGYYPEDKWWQAMLYPGYNQLVEIAKVAPKC